MKIENRVRKARSTITKLKVLFTEKKVLHFKESITFQCKYCKTKRLIYLEENILLNRKFYLFRRKYFN